MRSFVRLNPMRNGNITLSYTDVGKSCPSKSQICLLALFAKSILAKISEFTVIADKNSRRIKS